MKMSAQLRMIAKGRFANGDAVAADRLARAAEDYDRLEQENAELKSVLTKVLSQAEHRAAARHIFERDEFEWAVNRLNKLNKE